MSNQVKIKIKGKNPNYFLKLLIYHNISLYSVEKGKDFIIIVINYKDYNFIKEMKTSYKIQVLERYGISRIHYYFKKYWYIFLFIILGLVLIEVSSQLILDVEVVHPNQKLVSIIEKDLEELGISPYHFKVSYSKREKIKNQILIKEKDLLEWIEIEEEGTKYKVILEERKKNSIDKECLPRDIVARKNAIIIEIKAESGEIIRKKNDYVVKGETIISGLIHNKDTIVSKKCAKGTVYGEVWYRMKLLLPKEEVSEKLDKKKTYGFSITYFDKEFVTGKKNRIFQKTEYNIIESRLLPIRIGFSKIQDIQLEREVYTPSMIEERALILAEEKIGDEVLMKKVLKMIEKDSKIEVEVFLKVKEDITDYLDISNLEIPKEE